VAEWLRSGLQSRLHRFDSGRRLVLRSDPQTRVPRLPALDGVRGYAILGVVALHLLGAAGFAQHRGTTADILIWGLLGNVIDAFFIISGFGLFLPTVARSGDFGSLRRYALDRAARLLPAYWLSLVLTLALIALVRTDPPLSIPGASSIALHVAGMAYPARLVHPSLMVGFGVNWPLWMISVLIGLYVVLPLIARVYFRRPLLGLAVAAAITLGWREAALHANAVYSALGGAPSSLMTFVATDQLPGWAFSFALGMTGACLYVRLLERRERGWIQSRAALAMLAAVPLYGLTAYLFGRSASTALPQVGGAVARSSPLLTLACSASRALLIGAVALAPAWIQRPLANRASRSLAQWSYGLYLVHMIVIVLVSRLVAMPTNASLEALLGWTALVLPVSLACGWLSSRYVERPARRWARSRAYVAGGLSSFARTTSSGSYWAFTRRRRSQASGV
jgi:acetyltransferase